MTTPLDIVILGLTITSSWGNGHATTYRGLVRALAERGHRVLFLERDVYWYAENRDMPAPQGCRTALYASLDDLTTIHYDVEDPGDAGVAVVTLDRPESRNAQNKRMTYEMNAAFDDAARRTDVKVIVLRAAGPHFSSGHDMRDRERWDESPTVTTSAGYRREGKRYVTIAVGCTGGKHRSVAMSERLAARLAAEGVETVIVHRDMGRE